MTRSLRPLLFALLPLVTACTDLDGFLGQSKPVTTTASYQPATLATAQTAIVSEPLASPPRIEPPPAPPQKITPKLRDAAAVDQANAAAQQGPKSEQFINAIMTYDWVEGVQYQVYTAPPRITDIGFEEGETIVSFGAGDTIRWKVAKTWSGEGRKRQEHLLIKPLAPDLDTSLIVTTSRRSYHLRLRSFAETAMVAVRWQYPKIDLFEAEAEMPENAPPHADDLSFGYEVTSKSDTPPRWMPRAVYDDGRKIYIRFPAAFAATEAPVLYVMNGQDSQMVNYRVQGNLYIVDRLFETAQLRVGQQSQTVVDIRRTD
ncbi:P-type conjugative transfer protein TrbG [Lacibacterium aquatile]|uniref:P-type conjugative transfer protein TrbG n=1 Tax=Lacibacterium aquatile TaxID=1168082 RepID=A0ABW5DLB4_9PROT